VEFFDAVADLASRISPGWLFEDPQRARSVGYIGVLVLFVAAFVAGLVLALGSKRLSKGNRLHARIMERYGAWLGWVGGVGMLVIALRYADIVLFSKRLWTALNLLALIIVLVHFAMYWFKQYPLQLAEYKEEERRRKHFPAPQPKRSQSRPARRRR